MKAIGAKIDPPHHPARLEVASRVALDGRSTVKARPVKRV
jgi:hypothetical protein